MTNRTSTRRALLSSVMALLLCCTMLIGTTFAWFTDTATTSVNKIQAGSLKITLEDANGNSLEGQSLSWQKAEGHENETVLWEPGCTYDLQPVTIKNNGNLALKYKVVITGIQGDAKLNEVIDWTIKIDESTYSADSEFHLTAGQVNTLTISGHMLESAGNAYQGESIDGISITVFATQDTVESDSNGNQYDKDAEYNVITGDAVLNGTYIALDDNGNQPGDKNAVRVVGGNVVIEGGYYDGASGGNNAAVRVDAGASVTIKGGYFTVGPDAKGDGNNVIYAKGGNITIEGGTFYTEYTSSGKYYTLNCKDNSGGQITVKGGAFYMFDPSDANTGKGEIVVPDGYHVVQNGDWYYVVTNYASYVGDAEGLARAVKNGGNIVLENNITASGVMNITEDVTIYGCGHTITAATGATRIFNVENIENEISITLNNVELDAANAERGISFYNNSGKISLEMNDCTVTADHYAVNVASDNTDIEVIVKNSDLTGYTAVQTWSANSKITLEYCTLNGVNKWNGTDNDFSTVNVNKTAEGSIVTLNNCTIQNTTSGTAKQTFFGIAANATVTATDCSYESNGVAVSADAVRENAGEEYVYIATGAYTLTIN